MSTEQHLRFSLYCQPQIRHGSQRLYPSSMTESPERLAYLEGAVEYANLRLDRVRPSEAESAMAAIRHIPFAAELLEVVNDGGWRARPHASARASISFDLDRIATLLLDGRARQDAVLVQTGADTPRYASFFTALARGAARSELLAWGNDHQTDVAPVLDALMARKLVESVECVPRTDRRFLDGTSDRVTWLGHAALLFQAGEESVWVDPLLVPRLDLGQDHELFGEDFADATLFAPYGPSCPNLSWQELPDPNAVCITHQDADHIDLGVLMCLPETTLIVVPACDGSRPWEVDLRKLIHRVLGTGRNVVALAHGERLAVGAIEITALPFRGEMPPALAHEWNSYHLCGRTSSIACLADARVDDVTIDALEQVQRRVNKPLVLFSGLPRPHDVIPGWREGVDTAQLLNMFRLWGWYVPTLRLFEPTQASNILPAQIVRLRDAANLRACFPYAMGSAPWFRIRNPADPFGVGVSSMTRRELLSWRDALPNGVELLPARYGQPVPTTR